MLSGVSYTFVRKIGRLEYCELFGLIMVVLFQSETRRVETMLLADAKRQEVEDIQKSVSMGQSWHSYQKFKQYKQELSEAKSEIAQLKRDGYQSGAVTALSYIAMTGASIQDIVDTMEVMGVMLDAHTDASDMERFVEAYGADALRSAGVLE